MTGLGSMLVKEPIANRYHSPSTDKYKDAQPIPTLDRRHIHEEAPYNGDQSS